MRSEAYNVKVAPDGAKYQVMDGLSCPERASEVSGQDDS